jgi:putative PIN family toxin of toxin-antitoxin system
MRLVLDTNVIVSSFINPNGSPAQIMKIILSRRAELFYNSAILSEYESIMLCNKFSEKINSSYIQKFIDLIRNIGISFSPFPGKIKLPEESERIFFDTARDSGSVLISGNLKHFPKKPFIMPPAVFLKQFRML